MRPLHFGINRGEHQPRATYGRNYWTIGLPDGREAVVLADAVEVLPCGALMCLGGFRTEAAADIPIQERQATVILPAGAWVHAYATNGLSGDPVAILDLSRPA